MGNRECSQVRQSVHQILFLLRFTHGGVYQYPKPWEGKRTRSPYQFIQRCPRAGSRQIIILRGSTQSVIPPDLSSVVRLKTCNCALSVCVKSGCRSPRGGLGLKSLPHVEKCSGIFPSQTVLRLRVGMWCGQSVAQLIRKLKICSFITSHHRCASRGQAFVCRFLVSLPYFYFNFWSMSNEKKKKKMGFRKMSRFLRRIFPQFLDLRQAAFSLGAKRMTTNHSWKWPTIATVSSAAANQKKKARQQFILRLFLILF